MKTVSNGEKKKRIRISTVVWIAALCMAVLISVCAAGQITWTVVKNRFRNEDGHLIFTLREAREIIKEHYFYYTEDENDLTDAALKGLAKATGDRYAEYYTAEEYEELKKQNDRTYVGIGVVTQIDENGAVKIIDVYSDTPASEAGLLAGDTLIQLNGVTYEGGDLTEFLSNIKAEDGAENLIVVKRGEETLTFTVIARVVRTPAVSYRMVTDSIGYIHILSFHGTCVEETRDAIDELREQGMKSLVLDLRDNLGGNLYDAVNIADIFLPKDYVVTTLRSRTDSVQEFKTSQSGFDIRTALLVNGYSASASELVAGALKDYDAAFLIGTRTYGKGIVQTYYNVTETNGWLKLTTEAYFTPNGVCVQDEGIEPDLTVELPEEASKYSIDQLPPELDTQLQTAIAYLEE